MSAEKTEDVLTRTDRATAMARKSVRASFGVEMPKGQIGLLQYLVEVLLSRSQSRWRNVVTLKDNILVSCDDLLP